MLKLEGLQYEVHLEIDLQKVQIQKVQKTKYLLHF